MSTDSSTPPCLVIKKWGHFSVAAVPASWHLPPLVLKLKAVSSSSKFIWRFISELYAAAPIPLTLYITLTALIGVFAASSLYIFSVCLDMIQGRMTGLDSGGGILQGWAALWLMLTGASVIVFRYMDEIRSRVNGYVQTLFLPFIGKKSASLGMKFVTEQESRGYLPDVSFFDNSAPGMELLDSLMERLRIAISLSLQLLIFGYIILMKGTTEDTQIVVCIAIGIISIMAVAPTNAFGGAGYTYWTHSPTYHRLHSFFTILLSETYRETMIKDGMSKQIVDEFQYSVENHGPSKDHTFDLAVRYPPAWYWTLALGFIDHPTPIYMFAVSWSVSLSTLSTIVLLQHLLATIKSEFRTMRNQLTYMPLEDFLGRFHAFYDMIDSGETDADDSAAYAVQAETPGMKVELCNVTLDPPQEVLKDTKSAVKGLSMVVPPSRLVIIAGTEPDKVSSIVGMISGITKSTSGGVKIDDQPWNNYDTDSLRLSMAHLKSTDKLYPLSLKENLLLGYPDCSQDLFKARAKDMDRIQNALELAGALEVATRIGYDTVLNRPQTVCQSIGQYHGMIDQRAMDELRKNTPERVRLSDAETQRLVAARTFMRLSHGNSNIRLVILEDPVPALAPHDEYNIIKKFLERSKGKTVILITPRFKDFAKYADLIFCMDGTRVVEQGTHNQLILDKGTYAALYNENADLL